MDQLVILPRAMPEARARQIERVASILRSLTQTLAWRISITESKPKRSDQQNRYLWGVVYKTILDSGQLQGWEAEDLHEYFLGEHYGWEVIEGFGKKRMRPVRRSSALNKQEFTDYVDFIQRKMAEIGIYVPDANEELAA